MIENVDGRFRIFRWGMEDIIHLSNRFRLRRIVKARRLVRIEPIPTGFFYITVDVAGAVKVRWAEIRTEENILDFTEALDRAFVIHTQFARAENYRPRLNPGKE